MSLIQTAWLTPWDSEDHYASLARLSILGTFFIFYFKNNNIYIYIFTSSLFQSNAPGPLPWTKPYGLPLGRCVTQCEACGPTNVRWRLLSADFGYAPCFFFFININYWPLTYSLVISPFQVFNWDGYYLVWKRLK